MPISRSPSRRSRALASFFGDRQAAFPLSEGTSVFCVISMVIIFTSHAAARSVPQTSLIKKSKIHLFSSSGVGPPSDFIRFSKNVQNYCDGVDRGGVLQSIFRRDDRNAFIWYSGRTRGRIDFTHMDIVPCPQMCACIYSERGKQASESGGIYEKMFMCVMDHLRRTGHRGL